MPQIEIGNVACEQLAIREARAVIGRGEARDRERGIDGVPNACGEKSELLACPLFCPTYTVTPMPLSRLYSMVSTSPRRTVTVWPKPSLTSVSAAVAPRDFAWSRTLFAISRNWSEV